jgi:hypothetical protein
LDEVELSLRGSTKEWNGNNNKEEEVYLDEITGDWKAGNATLVEISGEDGTEGRLVNVNGGERVLKKVGRGGRQLGKGRAGL